MIIKARHKTSKECILTRFLVWCNSSLPFAFASSKYLACRRLVSPASSIAENETRFTVSLIFQTVKLERNIQASKAVCTRSSFPFLELRRQVTERRVWKPPFLRLHTPHIRRRQERLKLLEGNFAICSSGKHSYKNTSLGVIFSSSNYHSARNKYPSSKGFKL